jgi:hypothetical protein
MPYRVALLGALCGLLVGCGVTVNYHRLNAAPADMDPRDPEDVAVFTTREPPYEYVDVGMLEVRQESIYSTVSEKQVFAAMRKAAGKHGCDGLIFMGAADSVQIMSTMTGTGAHSSFGTFGGTLHGYRGTCIARVPKPRPQVPPPVAAAPPPAPKPQPPPADYVDPFAGEVVCNPVCSPGYTCRNGGCVPTCNPPCPADQVCGADRTCRRP